MKKCTTCKKILNLECFGKRSQSKDGLQFRCKSCQRDYRQNNKEKIYLANKKYNENNKEKITAYYASTKELRREKRKLYEERRREVRKVYEKQYRIKNKEQIAKRQKEHRENNKELYSKRGELNRKSYKKENSAYQKKVRKENPARYSAYTANRRAKKANATPDWSETDKIKLLYEKCLWLSSITGLTYHVDHDIPISNKNVCGLHVWANLQILEESLNCSKGNKF